MPPALPTTPCGTILNRCAAPLLVLELFLDLDCPFSARMWNTVSNEGGVIDTFDAQFPGKVQFVMHNVPQPWHPQSCMMHEASFAVKNVDEAMFRPFVSAVFSHQDQFLDSACFEKSRSDIYEDLANIAAGIGVNKAAVLEQLALKGEGNGGNAVTQQMKFAAKFHRNRGMHVTPTVLANGLEASHISSGWTIEEWTDFLQPWTT